VPLPLKEELSYIPAYTVFYYCDTSRKFAGAILDDAIGILHWHNPSGHAMALESTQPLISDNFWEVKAASV
jgi:hypothetical protein